MSFFYTLHAILVLQMAYSSCLRCFDRHRAHSIRKKMPKIKESIPTFYRRMVKEYPGVFRADNSVLFCLLCGCDINAKQLFQVKQHLSTGKHLTQVEKKNEHANRSKNQTLITEFNQIKTKPFELDLAKCFLNANIPLYKLRNDHVANFLEKYTNNPVPSESLLRSKYVPLIYDECIDKMKKIAAGKYLWVSVDETTDCEQRYIVNFIFGILDEEKERGKSYLFAVDILEMVNNETIAAFFDKSVMELGERLFFLKLNFWLNIDFSWKKCLCSEYMFRCIAR